MASKKIKRQKDLTVNLLPQDAFSKSSVGRVLNWSLSTGRYIVVFTEMIVILTFLSRFTLDRQLTDLNESILRKQAIVDSFGELESNIREIQAKTEFIRQLDSRVQAIELLTFLSRNSQLFKSFSPLRQFLTRSRCSFTSGHVSVCRRS